MSKKFELEYLGFLITNTWNSDGYVLQGKPKRGLPLWQCHLGNYQELDEAKKAALFYFMLDRPEKFATHIQHRAMYGYGCSHEWFTLKTVLEKEGIEMPEEITHSNDANLCIVFNGVYFAMLNR
jgi:hypothetical protein